MTAERLEQIRGDVRRNAARWSSSAIVEMYFDELLASHDAIAARVAELEAELAAARKVGDDEVAKYVLRVRTIANHALDPSPARDDLHYAADLLTRLTARALAAEAQLKEAREALRKIANSDGKWVCEAGDATRPNYIGSPRDVARAALKDTTP